MNPRNELIINKIDKANDFAGIKIDDKGVNIYVPAFFHEVSDTLENRRNLLLFIRSIEIAKTIENVDINKQESGNSIWPIESFLWIIRDFLENGFYYNKERKYYSDSKGKIDWKKTIRTTPIVSNGNVIYDKLVTSRVSAADEEITTIYKICLKKAVDCISWLIPSYDIQIEVQQAKTTSEMVHIVNKNLNNTFDDVKRKRFNHMLEILKNADSNKLVSDTYSYGIYNYYYVFERMVDELFQGLKGKEKEKYNPNGYWALNNRHRLQSSNLRPDTVYKKDNKTYIIDAKMYQYGATADLDDLPKTSSMQKQITYGDFVKNNVDKTSEVRNAFILPYDKYNEKFVNEDNLERFNDSNLVYIGYAAVDWRKVNQQQDYEYIFTFMIDFNYLLQNYNVKNSSYINTLCYEIDKKLLSLKTNKTQRKEENGKAKVDTSSVL